MPEVCMSSMACTSLLANMANCDGDMASASALATGVGRIPLGVGSMPLKPEPNENDGNDVSTVGWDAP